MNKTATEPATPPPAVKKHDDNPRRIISRFREAGLAEQERLQKERRKLNY